MAAERLGGLGQVECKGLAHAEKDVEEGRRQRHVVVDDECFQDGHAPKMLDQLQACVADHFPVSIEHSTFQLEPARHGEHEHETHR